VDEKGTITLATIANGAAEELFSDRLTEVLRNVNDPNTDWKAARKITIEVAFRPNEERTIGDIHIKASSKLAGLKPVQTVCYMGRQNGKLVAVENNPKQLGMFDAASGKPAGPVGLASVNGGKQ